MKKNFFCIGSNKTGTSSFRELFINVGLNVSPQKHQEVYFNDKKKLIILNFKEEKSTDRLFNFLEIKNLKFKKFPHVLKK